MPPHTLDPADKIVPVLDALREYYGKVKQPDRDPLQVLVRGVLSQNTSDVNSARAYDNLMETFGSWEKIARADASEVQKAIQSGGLAERKARTILAALRWLGEEDGTYSLDFLGNNPPEEGEKLLRQIKGVGVKTARLVLLFGFEMPTFVVDTHVLRVSQRLRLVPENCGREKAHRLLSDLVPPKRTYCAHMNMIEHGRTLCRPSSPDCDGCPVRQWCVYVRVERHTH
jgi:endonuclease-3